MKTTEIANNNQLSVATPVRVKKSRVGKLLRISILLLSIIILLFIFLVLALPHFHVRDVIVEGCSFYSEEELVSLSGIRAGDPIMELHLNEKAQNILAKCRYIKSITTSVRLSGSVVFSVKEEQCLMYTQYEDKYYSFSDRLKVLETSEEPFSGFLYIELPDGVTLKEGSQIRFSSSALFAKNALLPLVTYLQSGEYAKQLTEVSFAEENGIYFSLNETCKVILGDEQNLEEKEILFEAFLAKKGGIPEEKLTIDLSNPKNSSISSREN